MTLIKHTLSRLVLIFTGFMLAVSFVHIYMVNTALTNQSTTYLQSKLDYLATLLPNQIQVGDMIDSDIQAGLQKLLKPTPELSAVLAINNDRYAVTPTIHSSSQSLLGMFLDIPTLSISRQLQLNNGDIARLTVELPPSKRERLLQQIFVQYLLLSSIVFIVMLVIGGWLLSRKIKPIADIATQADLIQGNQFKTITSNDSSQEALSITTAINHMVNQLEMNFRLQAKEAVKLKDQAYRDNVSGLGNRQFFITQMNSWQTGEAKGGVIILKSTLIDDIYQQSGYEKGDDFVKRLAEGININIIHGDASIARLSYDEFAVIAPNITEKKLKAIGESLLTVHDKLQKSIQNETPDCVHIGLLMVNQQTPSSQLLAQLDNVLAMAVQNPQEPYAIADSNAKPLSLGRQQWKSLLIEAIDQNKIEYHYQPVADENDAIQHFEVFSAIQTPSERYSAAQFLGAIEDVGAGVLLDRHVIAFHINRLNADHTLDPISINLTGNSVSDPSFIRWLTQILEKNKQLSKRLCFEIPESSFIRTPDACGLLCSAIRFYKFRFGVDNFGRYFNSLEYLTEFRPDYVKIDFSYTHQLNDHAKINLLSSICRTAHSLNIMTIATRVETETQLDRLSDLFVSGFQGYIIEQQYNKSQKKHRTSLANQF